MFPYFHSNVIISSEVSSNSEALKAFKWFNMILLFNLRLRIPKPKQYLSEKFDVVTKFWGKNYFQKFLSNFWKEDVLCNTVV